MLSADDAMYLRVHSVKQESLQNDLRFGGSPVKIVNGFIQFQQ
ncbi:hypothetical protein SAMN04488122_5210 [Chitinophaga arvensicola]|uniref:Uncharacterized protein n=1 Tax=Chitinophaga arvensicola TaxID=29529 RepID=A0A1I0S9M1_9BACT|nr:hypothetical protein SAMN04488122_5210 [Chitinophaga arvensicola]